MSENLYTILGLEKNATNADIKRAYRKLARKFHPDVNPGDHQAEHRFKKISAAYAVLSDPDKRKKYDSTGTIFGGAGGGGGFEGFDFSSLGMDGGFGDIFEELFGGSGAGFGRNRQHHRSPGPQRGADLQYTIGITFNDSMKGLSTKISINRKTRCTVCGGNGFESGGTPSRCATCKGTGQTVRLRGSMRFSSACPSCGGSGAQTSNPCGTCGGDGGISTTETMRVKIPAGVNDGSKIRVAGKGDAGFRGGEEGDLFIITRVSPHPFLERRGDNIYGTIPITLEECLLGSRIEVPTVEGKTSFKVPPGTQPGQKFKLRGKGAPSLRGGGKGDYYVEVKLQLPTLSDERSKEIIREFSKLNPQEGIRDEFRHD